MKRQFPLSPEWPENLDPVLREKIAPYLEYQGDVQDKDHLNEVFTPLSFRERIHLLYAYFSQENVLVTSSFGTNSLFLLYLIHQLRPTQPIHFVDTTYHFPETHAYRRELSRRLNLRVIEVRPDKTQNAHTRREKMWEKDANACCNINKVQPLQPLKENHRVWMSGVMGFQTRFRAGLRVFEEQDGILKFHPLVDLSQAEFDREMAHLDLPPHPLKARGYGSVGCTHCTQKGDGRSGRWADQGKTECGLHPSFFSQKNPEDK